MVYTLFSLLRGEVSQEDYLNYNNIRIEYLPLPRRVYGRIFDYRDIVIIYINKNISIEKQKKTLIHEFAHYELNHLYKKKLDEFKIKDLEDEADKYVKYLLDNLD